MNSATTQELLTFWKQLSKQSNEKNVSINIHWIRSSAQIKYALVISDVQEKIFWILVPQWEYFRLHIHGIKKIDVNILSQLDLMKVSHESLQSKYDFHPDDVVEKTLRIFESLIPHVSQAA